MVLVFDYDGTLHDTRRLYGNAFRKAYQGLVEAGYAPEHYYSDDDMAGYLGLSPPEMWNNFMPELPDEVWKKASFRVREGMIRGIEEGAAVLFPGVTDVLDALREAGHTMVILSNCYHAYMEAHRAYFGLDRWFSGFYCSEDYGFRPKEEIFLSVAEKYGPGVEDNGKVSYIVIGDRASDFRVGAVNGIPVIGCAYGFGSEEELEMCDRIAEKPADLIRLIR